MKKLIAIAVLFVGITAAVLAQDGEWKVGFIARYTTDMLYATSVKEKLVITPQGSTSYTEEFGNYNKGTINFFGNARNIPHADDRLGIHLSNEGENYKVFIPVEVDNWVEAFGGSMPLMSFFNAASTNTDWYIRGNAGMFNGQIGSDGYGGFVDTQATWNSWLGWNQLCRFGIWRGGFAGEFNPADIARSGTTSGVFIASDQFRTWNEWGTIVALGATFADNYKFSIGYRINPSWPNWSNWAPGGGPTDSKSSINASFLFSGRPVDGVTFDLFYSVIGKDEDTIERPKKAPGADGYAQPIASWGNTIGAYVGLNIIDNLGLSLGYTVNFKAYEAGGWWNDADKTNRAVTYKAPIYSGIDLHIKYSGIDKVGLTFNNNVSFAGAKGQKNYLDPYQSEGVYFDTLIWGLNENGAPLSEGQSEDWFHWNGELTASLGFIDGVGLTVSLGDQLGAVTSTYVNPDVDGGRYPDPRGSKQVGVLIDNELRVSVFAEHGVGAVSIGTGLFFSLKSALLTYDRTYAAGDGSDRVVASSDTVTFGIPIMFKVQF